MLYSLWDPKKRGTLIFSTYRCGTHFLQQVLEDSIKNSIKPVSNETYSVTILGEFHADFTQLNFDYLNSSQADYTIGIVNSSYAKFFLTTDSRLDNWHVVHLTRNDKVSHFISEWVWRQNYNGEQKFKHHGGASQDYRELLNNPVLYDLEKVVDWLKEELINYHIPNTIQVDYSQLPSFELFRGQWQPNQYNLQLADLFTNHIEIEHLLTNFKI